ncbi:hypothetical protein [Planctomyces sp. SH-PL62]|uniref:hypothetical protein n=1 Tax=Planctomyces sp. SH-PL62 TaxID=1636152 RepID=UPI00078B3597|nr:hypothetical protein [Planctomyces sp. SH-PL62]AMV41016.1 hypothetical protein VT85_26510 [Planctomyces sp. SH-PL62]
MPYNASHATVGMTAGSMLGYVWRRVLPISKPYVALIFDVACLIASIDGQGRGFVVGDGFGI